jgi:predicted DNA-binding transcriptional regulator AlpA
MMTTNSRILNEKDVANWLGTSCNTIQRLRSRGDGPRYIRLSHRRVAYRSADIEEWLSARTVSSSSTSHDGPAANGERATGTLAAREDTR